MNRALAVCLSAIGLAIALAGIGMDFLLPNASPGLSLPQLLIIALGIAVAALPWLVKTGPRWASKGVGLPTVKTAAKALIITLLTLLALEIALSVWGIATYFPSHLHDKDFKVISYEICDERGCRLNYEGIVELCARGELSGRKCKVNRQGYADSQDFLVQADYAQRQRILALGDSFTQGFSADLGKSFIEVLEARFPKAVIWNAGITTTGTKQALAAYKELAPALRPQLTLLGFYMNDFADNIARDRVGIQLQDSDGKLIFRAYFQHDRWGNPVELPAELVYAYALNGANPPTSELERLVGLTRLGSLGLRLLDGIGESLQDRSLPRQAELTRQLLIELRDAVEQQDGQLLVIVVPRDTDFAAPSPEYRLAIELLDELGIAYMPLLSRLDPQNDYALPHDGHWNNSGHQKVGALLSECVAVFFSRGTLADCEHVTMP